MIAIPYILLGLPILFFATCWILKGIAYLFLFLEEI